MKEFIGNILHVVLTLVLLVFVVFCVNLLSEKKVRLLPIETEHIKTHHTLKEEKVEEVLVMNKPLASREDKNKWYWTKEVYPKIKKAGCGKCKNLCHVDKHDIGGLTCVEIAERYNQEWYVNELNSFHKGCKPHPAGAGLICKTKLLEASARDLLYKKYAKRFSHCSKKPFAMIVDSSVLEGPVQAVRHLQKMGGIKVDGLFGPKTEKYCRSPNFDPVKFTDLRRSRLKTRPTCWKHCKGWMNRLDKTLKDYYKK